MDASVAAMDRDGSSMDRAARRASAAARRTLRGVLLRATRVVLREHRRQRGAGNLHHARLRGFRHERVFARRAREETFQTDARRRAVSFRAKRREPTRRRNYSSSGIIRRSSRRRPSNDASTPPPPPRDASHRTPPRRSRSSSRSRLVRFASLPVRRRRRLVLGDADLAPSLDDDDRVVRVLASRVHHLASTHALATTLARECASKSKRDDAKRVDVVDPSKLRLVLPAFLLRRGHRREQRLPSRQTRRRLTRVARAAHLR